MLQYLKHIITATIDFLSPEDRKIKRWLALNPTELYHRLPQPRAVENAAVSALFDYRDDKVRALVRAIKYKGNRGVVKRMASYLYEEIIEYASDISLFEGGGKIIMVPMPTSDQRRTERGWSQCELLCQEIEKLCGENLAVRYDILKKIRDTAKQTDLKREERLNNVKGSMKAHPPAGGENSLFIVIDDVYTTGATFAEAKRALKSAGAKKVFGFFLAH